MVIRVKEVSNRAWYIVDISPLPSANDAQRWRRAITGLPANDFSSVISVTSDRYGDEVQWIYYVLSLEVSSVNNMEPWKIIEFPPLPKSHPGVEVKSTLLRIAEDEVLTQDGRVNVLNKRFASRSDAVNSFQRVVKDSGDYTGDDW